jgi:hypothetical protein
LGQTLDWYAQDKNGNVWYFGEKRYFAPRVGEVLITLEKNGTERMELTEIKK